MWYSTEPGWLALKIERAVDQLTALLIDDVIFAVRIGFVFYQLIIARKELAVPRGNESDISSALAALHLLLSHFSRSIQRGS